MESDTSNILAHQEQILALCTVLPGRQAGEVLKMECKVTLARETHDVSDVGEGPGRGREQKLCALDPETNDIVMGRESGCFLEAAGEVVRAEMHLGGEFGQRKFLGKMILDIALNTFQRHSTESRHTRWGGLPDGRMMSEQVNNQQIGKGFGKEFATQVIGAQFGHERGDDSLDLRIGDADSIHQFHRIGIDVSLGSNLIDERRWKVKMEVADIAPVIKVPSAGSLRGQNREASGAQSSLTAREMLLRLRGRAKIDDQNMPGDGG